MKLKNKLVLFLLSIGLITTACNNKYDDNNEVVESEVEENNETEERVVVDTLTESKVSTNNIIEYESVVSDNTVKEKSLDDLIELVVVKANTNVNIREYSKTDSKILGLLHKDETALFIAEEEDFYKILYNDEYAYVSKEYSKLDSELSLPYEFSNVLYSTKEKTLYDGKEEILIPPLECFEVYYEYNDKYLVGTNDYFGYIDKDDLEELKDTFVVVDISDQELKLYKDNKVILTSPIVSGLLNESRKSDEGIFKIYSISKNRYLVGPNYRTYVDVMMKYNGGEGLHDAEYHTCNGKSHGWRDISEFGGDTYIKDGSHGCINMPHDAAMKVYDNVSIGTKVLVKK